MDILFELYRLPEDQGMMWPPFNLILLKRVLDSGFLNVHQRPGGVFLGGMKTNPELITLTKKGRDFVRALGVTEL